MLHSSLICKVMTSLHKFFVIYVCSWLVFLSTCFILYLCRALSLVSCSSVLRAGVVSCTETGTTSPYGGSSLAFCCPGDTEFHQALESNLTTVLFLLYCDISLAGQSDKSHMTSLHERTDRASSRCCRAVTDKKRKEKHSMGRKKATSQNSDWEKLHSDKAFFYPLLFCNMTNIFHNQVCMKKSHWFLKKLNTISIGSRHIQDWPKGIQCTLVF